MPARASAKTKTVTRDPEGTRRAILDAAVAEFAREGFGGARVDRISVAAKSNERMLYYYFNSKAELYRAAIERVYEDLLAAEKSLVIDFNDPVAALGQLIEFNWSYYVAHPELISILNTENLYEARHIRESTRITEFSLPQLEIIGRILSKGIEKGIFHRDFDAESVFLTIASLTYFYLSNAHTLSNYLGRDLRRSKNLQTWLDHVKRVITTSLLA